jgi:hypothetical protein
MQFTRRLKRIRQETSQLLGNLRQHIMPDWMKVSRGDPRFVRLKPLKGTIAGQSW